MRRSLYLYLLAALSSGPDNMFRLISVDAVRQAQLVLDGRLSLDWETILVRDQSQNSAQSGYPTEGRHNEYQCTK